MARAKLLSALGPPLLGAGALALLVLIPVQADPQLFAPLNLGLPVFALIAFATILSASWIAGEGGPSARRLEAAALWAGCGLTLIVAAAAVGATAETVDPGNIVLAQQYTGLYLLKQPVAAWIFAVALALASHPAALDALVGIATKGRALGLGLLLVAFCGLGATLFLGGYLGGPLEGPAALILKTAAMLAFVLLLRASLARLTPGSRLAIAWAAAGAGLLNLVVTLVQLGP